MKNLNQKEYFQELRVCLKGNKVPTTGLEPARA